MIVPDIHFHLFRNLELSAGLDGDGLRLNEHGNTVIATSYMFLCIVYVVSSAFLAAYTTLQDTCSSSACVLQSCIAEAHQHVTTDLINHMIDEFNTAQAHQGADNEEASVDMAVKVGSVADGLAPAVHTAVQHDAEGVLDLQTRKRKLQELPFCPSKWAKGSSSQHCMLLDSSCDVEMKDS